MAKFTKNKDKVVLNLTYEDVWKAWCEKRDFFKTPVQVAAEKGQTKLNLVAIEGIRIEKIEGGIGITYFLTKESVFSE